MKEVTTGRTTEYVGGLHSYHLFGSHIDAAIFERIDGIQHERFPHVIASAHIGHFYSTVEGRGDVERYMANLSASVGNSGVNVVHYAIVAHVGIVPSCVTAPSGIYSSCDGVRCGLLVYWKLVPQPGI